jgi:hypothetical protein
MPALGSFIRELPWVINWPFKSDGLPSRNGTKPIKALSKVVLPTPLRPSKHGHLSRVGLQADIAQNVRAAIVLVNVLYIQHGLASQIHINHTLIGCTCSKLPWAKYRAIAQHGDDV